VVSKIKIIIAVTARTECDKKYYCVHILFTHEKDFRSTSNVDSCLMKNKKIIPKFRSSRDLRKKVRSFSCDKNASSN